MVYKLNVGTFSKKEEQSQMIFRENEWGNMRINFTVFRKLSSHQGRRKRRRQRILLQDRCLSSYKPR
jgi:hypothetical protein